MAPSTQYAQEYQHAVSAYMQGGYKEAAAITDQLVETYPEDPNLRLLRGHVYCCLQQYETAREQYQMVLGLTADSELLECANNSLADTEQFDSQGAVAPQEPDANLDQTYLASNAVAGQSSNTQVLEPEPADSVDYGSPNSVEEVEEELNSGEVPELIDPFVSESNASLPNTPFPLSSSDTDLFDFTQTSKPPQTSTELEDHSHFPNRDEPTADAIAFEPLNLPETEPENSFDDQSNNAGLSHNISSFEEKLPQSVVVDDSDITLLLAEPPINEGSSSDNTTNLFTSDQGASFSDTEDESGSETLLYPADAGTDAVASAQNALEFSDELGPPDFLEQPPSNPSYGEGFDFVSPASLGEDTSLSENTINPNIPKPVSEQAISAGLAASPFKGRQDKAIPTGRQGLAPFNNASLSTKQLITAGITGLVSAVAVVIGSQLSQTTQQNGPALSRLTGTGLVAIAAGVAGGVTTYALGKLTTQQIKRTTTDLRSQFNAVTKGNLGAKATVYSQDELGQLASSFNQMTQAISSITGDAQRRAEEQEKAKEALQRQVIRLLDEVEGAARGDLTVQAEVTADVLGAVADSFNLTIQNLQKLVQQVKVAARQVGKGAAENKTFARDLSVDALRQAEELAATLNSVQMMTNAIQRIAESAREADKVARAASTNALKGGDAVEQTVAAILQIRGTVAETTRKVKRLGESTQEINKFVGVIAQIASRTNLLALNASIEAARAGEAGRGFATVADEVRQLADRAGKSSKEIEQIVLQIQSETGQVMTAMEEGTQQVIEGTRLAEQAKQSLEDIIQVSSQIDALVSSITAATVEQTETSRSMAQVMQAVELTAQETSQEAQQVSSSLEHLVGVAEDLQASVERFKLESTEIG